MSESVKIREVIIQPTVLLTISDHKRRFYSSSSKKRVVGSLLGYVRNGIITISNCYPVPFDEKVGSEDVFFLDTDYHKKMIELQKKVNTYAGFIGWYSTSTHLEPADRAIHEVFGEPYIMICVDCDSDATRFSEDDNLSKPLTSPFKAYIFEQSDGGVLAPVSIPIRCEAQDVEKIVLDQMSLFGTAPTSSFTVRSESDVTQINKTKKNDIFTKFEGEENPILDLINGLQTLEHYARQVAQQFRDKFSTIQDQNESPYGLGSKTQSTASLLGAASLGANNTLGEVECIDENDGKAQNTDATNDAQSSTVSTTSKNTLQLLEATKTINPQISILLQQTFNLISKTKAKLDVALASAYNNTAIVAMTAEIMKTINAVHDLIDNKNEREREKEKSLDAVKK